MDRSKIIFRYSVSVVLLIFAVGSLNAAIWETVALKVLYTGLNSGDRRIVWVAHGPTNEQFIYLRLALLVLFAIPAFFKVRDLQDVYRRFRWIFAAASVFWVLIIPTLLALTHGGPWELSPNFKQQIPETSTMYVLTVGMTAFLFVRTSRKRAETSLGKKEVPQ
jgi:hypothetical protein